MQNLVRATLSLTFVIAAARVVFNVKARMTREATWQLELKGDLTKQRRVEAVDKLLSVLTLLVASVFGLQAIGLDGMCQANTFSGTVMGAAYPLHCMESVEVDVHLPYLQMAWQIVLLFVCSELSIGHWWGWRSSCGSCWPGDPGKPVYRAHHFVIQPI